jgi:Protein of unknown function (DUF3828)
VKLAVLAMIVTAAAASATNVADPETFVREVYRHIEATAQQGSYAPPDDIYTPRLKALFEADRRKHVEEVGCIDFDFWSNSQDPSGIRDIRVTSRAQSDPARRTVVATFTLVRPMEIHFEFRRIEGKWLLDDVSSLKSERWTLSRMLRCK